MGNPSNTLYFVVFIFVFVQKTKWFAPIPRVVEYRQRVGNLSSLLPDQAEEALDATRAAAEKAQHAAAEAWNTSDGLVSEKGTVGTVGRPYSSLKKQQHRFHVRRGC